MSKPNQELQGHAPVIPICRRGKLHNLCHYLSLSLVASFSKFSTLYCEFTGNEWKFWIVCESLWMFIYQSILIKKSVNIYIKKELAFNGEAK